MEKPSLTGKMRDFKPIFDHFLRKNCRFVTFGKINSGLYSGCGFHPLGERNDRMVIS